jgi:glycosyltransferase involved in cell wall biosynthesis
LLALGSGRSLVDPSLMPRVSVILPTRDRSALLSRAITSVLAQTGTDWELLVIDNNRAERPVVNQPAFAEFRRDPRVRVLRVERVDNAAAARNAGLEEAVGEWVTYLDDDDAYHPEKIARQLECAERADAPLALCGAAYRLRSRIRRVQCADTLYAGDELLLRAVWGTPFLLHRRGPVRFDATLPSAEDLEYGHRLCLHWHLAAVPVANEPLVEVYPQPALRVNADPAGVRRAAELVLSHSGARFTAAARRRFLARTDLAVAKLRRQPGECLRSGLRLLWLSAGADWRMVANAWAAGAGVLPGRWVS